MDELIEHVRRIGKKGVVLRYGVLLFGGGLVAVNVVRYWVAHDFAAAALASREFAEMLLTGLAVAPLLGAAWGWAIWKLVTWTDRA